ncbi:hypothetical protein [Nocardia sp. NPDC059239]|uniref:hypothetical protein n=1 Tax=unclassified Nocardia TaxID=2637762 RepID=UPI00367A1C07
MNEFTCNGHCLTSETTAVLGRYDEFIDITEQEHFLPWRNTPGLRCLVCRHPVEVYHSSRKNLYVRHGKGHGFKGTAQDRKSAGEPSCTTGSSTGCAMSFADWAWKPMSRCGRTAAAQPERHAPDDEMR